MSRMTIAVLCAAMLTSVAMAGEREDAAKLVGDAVAAVGKGKAAAIADIGQTGGKFTKGEVYVFAYDMEGTMVAHPINAKLVGKSLIDVPDAAGKMFRKEIIAGLRSANTVSVDYKYKNPKTNAIEDKATHCQRADDLAICAGYYK